MRPLFCLLIVSGVIFAESRRLNYSTEQISEEELDQIPTTFDENLKSLKIFRSKIVALENLSSYKNLQILTIQDSQIKMLNETNNEIFKLKQLQELNLIGNSIVSFKLDNLKKLPNLKRLNLANNQGIRIFGSGAWSKLISINLSNNNLTTLPVGIKYLKFLEEIIIDGNSLVRIPTYLIQLTHLKSISANQNPLNNIPHQLKAKVRGSIFVDEKVSSTSEDNMGITVIKTSIFALLLVILLVSLGSYYIYIKYYKEN